MKQYLLIEKFNLKWRYVIGLLKIGSYKAIYQKILQVVMTSKKLFQTIYFEVFLSFFQRSVLLLKTN